MNYFSINKYLNIGLVLTVLLFSIGCINPGRDITPEELKIVNLVIDDLFESLPYELECQIHPILQQADKYGGDFTPLIKEGAGVFSDGENLIANMNIADAIWLGNTAGLDKFQNVTTVIRTKNDSIPIVANRNKAILKMSTIGCNDAGNECVIIADRIFSKLNQRRHIYFLQKDANGNFSPLDKKVFPVSF